MKDEDIKEKRRQAYGEAQARKRIKDLQAGKVCEHGRHYTLCHMCCSW